VDGEIVKFMLPLASSIVGEDHQMLVAPESTSCSAVLHPTPRRVCEQNLLEVAHETK
jgi:hypothetical protein